MQGTRLVVDRGDFEIKFVNQTRGPRAVYLDKEWRYGFQNPALRLCSTGGDARAAVLHSQCFGALKLFTSLSMIGPNRFCCPVGYSILKLPMASSQSAI